MSLNNYNGRVAAVTTWQQMSATEPPVPINARPGSIPAAAKPQASIGIADQNWRACRNGGFIAMSLQAGHSRPNLNQIDEIPAAPLSDD